MPRPKITFLTGFVNSYMSIADWLKDIHNKKIVILAIIQDVKNMIIKVPNYTGLQKENLDMRFCQNLDHDLGEFAIFGPNDTTIYMIEIIKTFHEHTDLAAAAFLFPG